MQQQKMKLKLVGDTWKMVPENLVPLKPVTSKPKTSQPTVSVPLSDIKDFINKLTTYLYKEYGYKVQRPVYNNRRNCFHRTGQIYYGVPSITSIYRDGFAEYSTIRDIWYGVAEGRWVKKEGYKPLFRFSSGMEAIWMVVLHEFAHRIQHDKGTRFRGSVHNQYFVGYVQELQTLFPFEEIKEKFL